MYKTIEQRKQALKNTRIRKMKHFVMQDFNIPSGHYKAKNNIEYMTFTILDRLFEAWDVYCSQNNLGSTAMCVTRGWEHREEGKGNTPFTSGMAVEVAPQNNRVELFQKFCATLFLSGIYQFDMVGATPTGVQIICKTAGINPRNIVNLKEKL